MKEIKQVGSHQLRGPSGSDNTLARAKENAKMRRKWKGWVILDELGNEVDIPDKVLLQPKKRKRAIREDDDKVVQTWHGGTRRTVHQDSNTKRKEAKPDCHAETQANLQV